MAMKMTEHIKCEYKDKHIRNWEKTRRYKDKKKSVSSMHRISFYFHIKKKIHKVKENISPRIQTKRDWKEGADRPQGNWIIWIRLSQFGKRIQATDREGEENRFGEIKMIVRDRCKEFKCNQNA